MSTKNGRGAKVPTVPQNESQKGSSNDQIDSPNLSAIERASFLEGLQQNYGNPLHSTALEEDLNNAEEGQMKTGQAGRTEIPQKLKTTVKQRGAAAKRKETERNGENEKEEGKKKRSRRRTRGASAARPVNNQQVKKGKKRKSESGMSSNPESKEESDTGSAQQNRKKVLSSSEEDVDEDKSWGPSPKKARVHNFGRIRKSSTDKSKSRKSSSGSASTESEKANSDKQRKKRHGRQGGTELEVVLDTFLDFCDQYRESVESTAVKQSIDCFSDNVKEHLLEKISSSRELKVLKRENAKVGSLIRRKTQRLLDAKQELMRAERQAWLLQKEKAELNVRLADLRRGQAFLHDIRELNRQYLDYRHKNPKEKEMYGASSLPALLLETKHIQAAEHQLRGINNRLQRTLKKNETRK